ncbi:MAG: hypothetical protein QOG60_695 [Frankiaceae bacterium]|nr:hypothetical protein [Frankiaceae bacterium]
MPDRTDPEQTDVAVPTTLMWEARAADGRSAELLAWLLEAVPRGQVFSSADRVVLVLDLDLAREFFGEAAAELPFRPSDVVPQPPPELVARPPHAWGFARVRPS